MLSRMKSTPLGYGLFIVLGGIASAQSTPIPTSTDVAFEVASVKQNKSGERNSSTSGRAGAFTATNVTAQQLIVYAYRLRNFQLTGGPGWLGSDRFDIQARAPASSQQDNPAMTRALLRDRFRLVVHSETKQEQVYALVVDRSDGRLGPQLKPSTKVCQSALPGTANPCGMNTSVNDAGGTLVGNGQTMEQLVGALGNFGLNRMVINRTGLTGSFDIELKWRPDDLRSANAAQGSDLPSIFAALPEQLGLRLDSQRGPVEFLYVDRIERPAPD
jgi:uncharacterized protein (TIGR03435 family)